MDVSQNSIRNTNNQVLESVSISIDDTLDQSPNASSARPPNEEASSPYYTLNQFQTFHKSDPVIETPGECTGLIIPESPSQLFHTMGAPQLPSDDNLDSLADMLSKKGKFKGGVISGLPCTLDFSETFTTLTNVEKYNNQTVITIDKNEFIPGSIVMYKTRLNDGTLTDQSQLNIKTEDNLLKTLNNLLGMSTNILWTKWMSKFSLNSLDMMKLWFDSNHQNWPIGLLEVVSSFDTSCINVALFRSEVEERDINPSNFLNNN